MLHKKNDQFSLSIFSWSSEEISSNREELLSNLIDYKFNRIFQSFPSDLPEEEIVSFVLELTEKNIDVYALEGTPEWAFEPSGEGMIKQLQRIVQINQLLPEKQKIKGFVFDVEPYQLDDFEWEDEAIQHSFISAMKNVYEVAQQEGLELIVVVPYFYDTKGYIEVLKRFIHDASSEIAVMNYYREHEIEHLSFEAQEAKKNKKAFNNDLRI